jgi:hypothetical protein
MGNFPLFDIPALYIFVVQILIAKSLKITTLGVFSARDSQAKAGAVKRG